MALNATHADYFYGDIPCTRPMTEEEINPLAISAVLVCSHGPFVCGRDAAESMHHVVVLETVAEMVLKTHASILLQE